MNDSSAKQTLIFAFLLSLNSMAQSYGQTTVMALPQLQQPLYYLPRIKQAELRGFTESAIINRSVKFVQPYIKQKEDAIHYNTGSLVDATMLDRSPLHYALLEQYKVSLMRSFIPDEEWRITLEDVEKEISAILAYEKTTPEDLIVYENKINAIYLKKMNHLAARFGRRAVRDSEVGPAFQGHFTTSPPNGTIYRMISGDWELYKFVTKSKSGSKIPPPSWEQCFIGQNSVRVGRYWIYVVWPDGRYFKGLFFFEGLPPRYLFSPTGITNY